jgi:zinc protease
VIVAGDADPAALAALVKTHFGGWQVAGEAASSPSFGDPAAPAGSDPKNPVGDVRVQVEADLPRTIT